MTVLLQEDVRNEKHDEVLPVETVVEDDLFFLLLQKMNIHFSHINIEKNLKQRVVDHDKGVINMEQMLKIYCFLYLWGHSSKKKRQDVSWHTFKKMERSIELFLGENEE